MNFFHIFHLESMEMCWTKSSQRLTNTNANKSIKVLLNSNKKTKNKKKTQIFTKSSKSKKQRRKISWDSKVSVFVVRKGNRRKTPKCTTWIVKSDRWVKAQEICPSNSLSICPLSPSFSLCVKETCACPFCERGGTRRNVNDTADLRQTVLLTYFMR